MEKKYYVFKGQNASTGKPNPITGRMNFYGDVLVFENKGIALAFVEDFETPMANDICEAGTKRTMRKYCLGMSVVNFEEMIHQTYYTYKDENGEWQW